MARSLRGMLGPWAARIRELHACDAALGLLRQDADIVNVCEDAIEEETEAVLDRIARGLQERGITLWCRWAVEALFHPDVRRLLTPTFFQFFRVGDRIGEGDLRFVDEILHGSAFGPKAALVWWTYSLDRQRGLDALLALQQEASGPESSEDEQWELQADPHFVSEDARAFAKTILEETVRLMSAEELDAFKTTAAYVSWLALWKLTTFTESLSRTQFYEGRLGEQGFRGEGAYALARSYYNDACRLDSPRQEYEFLQEPY